jgi:hemolysin D
MRRIERAKTTEPALTTGNSALPRGRISGSSGLLHPLHADDREFLPSAVEIIVTPASPIAIWFIWLICGVFATAIAWSYFGQLDVYAVARGKIQVTGRSKVVQPIDPGKVSALFVQNGALVKEGDLLVKLDPTETSADQTRYAEDLMAASAEAARRKAAIESARLEPVAPLKIEFSPDTSQFVRQREQNVLAADLAQLNANLKTLAGQADQQRATERRLVESIAEREKLLALSDERVQMRQKLQNLGAGSRALIIEAQTQYETDLTSQIADKGQLKETLANISVTQHKIVEAVAQFIADQSQKLAEAERKRDQLLQDLIRARSKNEKMSITAPVSGVVEQLAVTTIGQVVNSGQVLMTIVPANAPLEVQALLQNQDIGFVRVGQPAVIKVDAFPFTRYGTIDGRVINVSGDAVDIRDAPNLSDASAAVTAKGAAANSSSSNPTLVFPATIALAKHSIMADDREVQLVPGMTVSVEIQTGKRRIIDYVLSPLREMTSGAAHER